MQEEAIRASVAKQAGTQQDSLGMSGKKVTLSYDPTRLTRDEVTDLVRQAGVQPTEIETERATIAPEEP